MLDKRNYSRIPLRALEVQRNADGHRKHCLDENTAQPCSILAIQCSWLCQAKHRVMDL
jgi:hypothetical protein